MRDTLQPKPGIRFMKVWSIRVIASLCVVLVTTAAMCNKDSSAAAPPSASSDAPAPTAAVSSGLPADFPLAPGLSPCKPIVMGPETICDWHNVDGHAIYTFYHAALPKAGYVVDDSAPEVMTPHYLAALGFKKGNVQGAITIPGTELSIQLFTGHMK